MPESVEYQIVTGALMLPLMLTVKTALPPSVTLPALLIVNVGGGTPLASMVAVPVVNGLPVCVDCRPTLKVSALSRRVARFDQRRNDDLLRGRPAWIECQRQIDELNRSSLRLPPMPCPTASSTRS